MSKVSSSLLIWRKKQKRGAIMEPQTFKNMVSKLMDEGHSKQSATNIAGKVYWKTAKKKYRKATQ